MAQEEERNRSGGDYALDSFRRFIPATGLLEAGPDTQSTRARSRSSTGCIFQCCLAWVRDHAESDIESDTIALGDRCQRFTGSTALLLALIIRQLALAWHALSFARSRSHRCGAGAAHCEHEEGGTVAAVVRRSTLPSSKLMYFDVGFNALFLGTRPEMARSSFHNERSPSHGNSFWRRPRDSIADR